MFLSSVTFIPLLINFGGGFTPPNMQTGQNKKHVGIRSFLVLQNTSKTKAIWGQTAKNLSLTVTHNQFFLNNDAIQLQDTFVSSDFVEIKHLFKHLQKY